MDDASLNPPFLTKEVEQMLLDEEVGASAGMLCGNIPTRSSHE